MSKVNIVIIDNKMEEYETIDSTEEINDNMSTDRIIVISEQELLKKNQEITNLKMHIDEKDEQLADLQNKLMIISYDQNHTQSLIEECNNKNKYIDHLQKLLDKTELIDENFRLKDTITKQKIDLETVNDENSRLKSTNSDYEISLNEKSQEISRLKLIITDVKQSLKEKCKKISLLKSIIADHKQSLKNSRSKEINFGLKNSHLKEIISGQELSLMESNNEISSLKASLEASNQITKKLRMHQSWIKICTIRYPISINPPNVNKFLFNANGVFITPIDVDTVNYIVIGGGGGGGICDDRGGGGSGQVISGTIKGLSEGELINITIGKGGKGLTMELYGLKNYDVAKGGSTILLRGSTVVAKADGGTCKTFDASIYYGAGEGSAGGGCSSGASQKIGGMGGKYGSSGETLTKFSANGGRVIYPLVTIDFLIENGFSIGEAGLGHKKDRGVHFLAGGGAGGLIYIDSPNIMAQAGHKYGGGGGKGYGAGGGGCGYEDGGYGLRGGDGAEGCALLWW